MRLMTLAIGKTPRLICGTGAAIGEEAVLREAARAAESAAGGAHRVFLARAQGDRGERGAHR